MEPYNGAQSATSSFSFSDSENSRGYWWRSAKWALADLSGRVGSGLT